MLIQRDLVKDMFYHAYDNYMLHAFPKDELKPISCGGEDTLGGYDSPHHQQSHPQTITHHSTTSLHHYITTSLHHCITPSLHHSITPSLHHSITPSLHHSITPSLHHSIPSQIFTLHIILYSKILGIHSLS